VTWLLLPVIAFIALRPNMYDGMRHALFLLPPMALLAAFAGAWLVELATKRGVIARSAAVAGVAIAAGLSLLPLIRLHPYQMTYFNFLVGGLHGAAGRYETDYWASSYREAMLWINSHAVRRPHRSFTILVGGGDFLEPAVKYDSLPNVHIQMIAHDPGIKTLPPHFDYFVATTRYSLGWRLFADAPIVHMVGRDGAAFTVIKGHDD
jgi:hypothetical protein